MADKPVRIVSVTQRGTTRKPLYVIRDAHGVRYATHSDWLASLCDRAWKADQRVLLDSWSGFYYRDLKSVKIVETPALGVGNSVDAGAREHVGTERGRFRSTLKASEDA